MEFDFGHEQPEIFDHPAIKTIHIWTSSSFDGGFLLRGRHAPLSMLSLNAAVVPLYSISPPWPSLSTLLLRVDPSTTATNAPPHARLCVWTWRALAPSPPPMPMTTASRPPLAWYSRSTAASAFSGSPVPPSATHRDSVAPQTAIGGRSNPT